MRPRTFCCLTPFRQASHTLCVDLLSLDGRLNEPEDNLCRLAVFTAQSKLLVRNDFSSETATDALQKWFQIWNMKLKTLDNSAVSKLNNKQLLPILLPYAQAVALSPDQSKEVIDSYVRLVEMAGFDWIDYSVSDGINKRVSQTVLGDRKNLIRGYLERLDKMQGDKTKVAFVGSIMQSFLHVSHPNGSAQPLDFRPPEFEFAKPLMAAPL